MCKVLHCDLCRGLVEITPVIYIFIYIGSLITAPSASSYSLTAKMNKMEEKKNVKRMTDVIGSYMAHSDLGWSGISGLRLN